MLSNPLRLPATDAARVAVPRVHEGGGAKSLAGIGVIVLLAVVIISALLTWSASSVWAKLGVGKEVEVEVVSTSLRTAPHVRRTPSTNACRSR